ncbi:MAG: type II toxin-antitoxin system HicB family antitoxin [Syntrophobacteraceae bacterium]
MQYLVVIEKAESNYSAYLPDLPGCVATGGALEETIQQITKAVDMHLKGLQEDGLPIPSPTARAEYLNLKQAS